MHYLYVCCKVINFEIKCKVFVDPGEFFFFFFTAGKDNLQTAGNKQAGLITNTFEAHEG